MELKSTNISVSFGNSVDAVSFAEEILDYLQQKSTDTTYAWTTIISREKSGDYSVEIVIP